jgi:KaiC/GvpD/RAD55 family RecA-like ATPase
MFRNAINGLEKLLSTEIPQGSVILVTGSEGTLKSGLVFSMVSNYLAAGNGRGLYVTLEQTQESHLKNMSSLGIQKSDNLQMFDYQDMRREWKDYDLDMIKLTDEVIDFYRDKYNDLTIFALDSLNALYSLSEESNLRMQTYRFFSNLRERGLTSFLIMENHLSRNPWQFQDHNRPEHFLADGTIELGVIEDKGGVKRYIQISKMRAVKHAMEKHQLMIDKNGINILGPIY